MVTDPHGHLRGEGRGREGEREERGRRGRRGRREGEEEERGEDIREKEDHTLYQAHCERNSKQDASHGH